MNCEVATNWKICIKGHKYKTYKVSKQWSSGNYLKSRKCDTFVYWEDICQYMSKKYYAIYSMKKKKCANYKNLSPKYTSNNK